jgi:ribitol-5-phosphate 2-dehydrogenase (NADP+) / D-ribitol-5-phosphate cytidylyltransferase
VQLIPSVPVTRLRTVAVVLAGGTGTRVGLEIPKQLIKISGKPIIEHTIATMQASPLVDEIVVMMAPGYLDEVRAIVKSGGYDKVSQILEGAGTRNDTTAAALAALGAEECNVLLHDAVRPLVSQTIIEANVAALQTHEAVDTAIPSADTVIQLDSDSGRIADVLPRHLLRRGQTPQSFRLSTIRAAYAKAAEDPNFTATDDCTVVLRYSPEVPIVVVAGHERNMKVTEPIDVYIADKLFQLTSGDPRVLMSDDAYRERLAGKTVVVFGGSYGIGGDLAELARKHGADVFTFSRSTTRTHVERRSDVAAAASEVLEKTGRIDYVVNSAGLLPRGELIETTEETIYAATDVNYLGPIFVAQEFYPHLARTGGSLLLFTSSSYTRGRSGYSLYSSAKAAVVNLTQALADEWATSGVRVNCVNPERTGTPMRTKAFGDEPPGTLLASAEVARQSLDVLVSPITGHIIDIRRAEGPAALVEP